ncbi:disease resistance protein RPP8 isoform X2 [Hevea brasiliensis]|uniref:disease resistance protein RPP8 isoform X2 n=1 Tax=Hevea brasiliensis TaxID=3981 RepID=UPI0025DB1C36|nr:disease resistance protein RPP8 isoform X2 [Hevea brasiliensis]
MISFATRKEISPAVQRQARYLRDKFRSLQDFLKQSKSKELSEVGMAWMEELGDVCRSAENVVGLFMDSKLQKNKNGKRTFTKLVWSSRNFISQHKIAQKLAWIEDKIRDIYSRRYEAIPSPVRNFDPPRKYFQSLNRMITRIRAADQLDDQLDIVSFNDDVDAVTAQLLKEDPRCLTISIVGVPGIGKTSLAQLIYDSQAIANHFPHRVWVSRSGLNTSKQDIMKQILGIEGSDLYRDSKDTEESYIRRVRQMVNAFFMDKKYLVVIDDSYSSKLRNAYEFWRGMGSAFSDISNGTRILFTVCHLWQAPPVTETDFTYRLHLRTNDESWALFTHILKVNIPPEMQYLKGRIIRKCGGSPTVIVKLVELLSQRDATLEEWSRVLDELNQDEETWSAILEEINNYLPLYLRRCLFYFGLFPAGYKIPTRRLIALWVAEGLGHQQGDAKSPEYVAETCLRELINYDVVQLTEKKLNGKIKTCCLPEALQVHWFKRAQEANFLQGHSDISSTDIGVIRRLADHLQQNDVVFDDIHRSNSVSPCSRYRDVVSFLSFDTREGSEPGEEIGNFLDRCISSNCFRFLWVLDLEKVYKPKLPKAVGQLVWLKYLGLRYTYLEMLPAFINKLLNLQTLDLKRTCINTLPSSIWKMQKLRHLFLEESFCSAFVPPQEESSLVDLQTLRGAFVGEDSPVRNGLDSSLNITNLGLKCKISVPSQKAAMSSQLVDVENWVRKLKHLQSLRLKSFDESGLPWDLHLRSLSGHVDLSNIYLVGKLKNQQLVSELPGSLIELTLSASGLVEDPMQTLDKLPNLRILRLFSRSFMGKKMLCCFGGFPKLEVLKFWELELLEEWNVEEGAMPNLKDLEIRRCMNLKLLPSGLQCIKTIRQVKLTKLPILSSSLEDKQGEDWKKIAHVRHVCIED